MSVAKQSHLQMIGPTRWTMKKRPVSYLGSIASSAAVVVVRAKALSVVVDADVDVLAVLGPMLGKLFLKAS